MRSVRVPANGAAWQRGSYLEDPVLSSYLELELFAAALLRKPILVLHLAEREVSAALRDSMQLLQRAFTRGAYHVDDEDGLCRHFRSICRHLVAGKGTVGGDISIQLPDWLSRRRTRSTVRRDLTNPALMFVDGRMTLADKSADIDRAKALLDQVASGRSGDGNGIMPHGAAAFRLWAAIRELMDGDGGTRGDPLVAPLWDRAFGLWASSASWLGFHGHLWMGPLAAVNSQTRLRQEFAGNVAFRQASDVREPLGARASALYSIAQRLHSRRRQAFHYKEVERLATQAIAAHLQSRQGALSIRAHSALRLATLGRYWKIWDAERDFREALRLHERSGAAPARVGESKADLGFLLARTFRSRRGFALMHEGIGLLRQDAGANGLAFLMRALRKLEQAAAYHGDRRRAEEARLEIKGLGRDRPGL